VGVGSNGSVWVIGSSAQPGGYNIARWSGSGWSGIFGGAVRITVDGSGLPWVVNNGQLIYRRT
jgi:hypothetical protein